MKPISVPLGAVGNGPFDVIVIGSGYGGSIAASRLARAGQKVCLLERGREILPGGYPTDLASARAATQIVTARDGRLDPAANGMMEIRLGPDMHVVLGNGLGGGSLVNAGVAIEPDSRVFQSGWPAVYAPGPGGPATQVLAPHYDAVRAMLGVNPLPGAFAASLPKLRGLRQSAAAMGREVELAPIAVTFAAGSNAAGLFQPPCVLCGDCCSGCNYGAKNTLIMNYLPDAHAHGAVIVTEAEVLTIAKAGAGWAVTVQDRSSPEDGSPPKVLKTGTVVLSAGALGSTEILFRSAAAGLPLAKANLGRRFSGNGDILGFGFGANLDQSNQPPPLYSIGAGTNAPVSAPYRPGPTITGIIRVDMDDDHPLQEGMVIEDGVAPGPLAAAYPAMMFLQDVLDADVTAYPDATARLAALKALGQSLLSGTDTAALSYGGVMARLQSYLVMSHDNAGGVLAYDAAAAPGLVSVDWAGVGQMAPYPRDNEMLRQAAEGIWANYIANPLWSGPFGWNLVTVHPVGGCAMADSAAAGVTDADCRLYTGSGNDVHDSFLVCDGSVLPTALGVNPLLTISAVADRAMTRLIARRGWSENKAPNPPAATAPIVPVQPVPATPAPGWQDNLAKRLGDLSASFIAAGVASAADSGLMLGAALDAMVADLPTDDQATVKSIIEKDLILSTADLPGDFSPAFTELDTLTQKLIAAIKSPPAGQSSVQALIGGLVAAAGDLSPRLSFAETMAGHVSDRPAAMPHVLSDPYRLAEALGRSAGRRMAASLTVTAASTLGFGPLGQPVAQIVGAALTGSVTVAWPGKAPMSYVVNSGRFSLLQPDPDQVETWVMTYDCQLGSDWQMRGTKYLARKPGSSWWGDLTTLFVDLTPLSPTAGLTAQCGIIRLDLQDLARQAGTITAEFASTRTLDQFRADLSALVSAHGLHQSITQQDGILHEALRLALAMNDTEAADGWPARLTSDLKLWFMAGIAGLFGGLILRSYGGFVAYMQDFPAAGDLPFSAIPDPDGGSVTISWNGTPRQIACKTYRLAPVIPGAAPFTIQLYHFAAPGPQPKGPVILSPGMSTTALSFAAMTVEKSLVQMLLETNHDVWLFDNRMSPLIRDAAGKVQTGYSFDEIAACDWPAAVDFVLKTTGASDVQIIAHCVGALTAQMALLSGSITRAQVRKLVVSQFTVHASANWYNLMNSDTGLAQAVTNGFPAAVKGLMKLWTSDPQVLALLDGLASVNTVSPAQPSDADAFLDALAWNAPTGIDRPCLSPTCHRIFGMFGPSFAHANLNEATHNGIRQFFGEIATTPFEHLGLIMSKGHVVNRAGEDVYLPNWRNLDLPIHMIAGSVNQILLPDGSFRTLSWLQDKLPGSRAKFSRRVIDGYAHMDCFIGKNAHVDVFPDLIGWLDDDSVG